MTERLLDVLSTAAARAIHDGLGVDWSADLRATTDARFGDFQINGVLPLAKQLRDNPRKLAVKVAEALDTGGVCLPDVEIAGPGFINLRLNPAWVAQRVGEMAADGRLGIAPVAEPDTIVIDFSAPNVAKRMHVGHLRSTIIGAALVETLRFLGHRTIGDNHVGDWGTQFGILLWAWKHHADEAALGRDPIGELERLYKLGSSAGKEDEAVAEACRAELAALQGGDADRQALWERFVAISRAEAQKLYDRLDVSFDEWRGESAYNDDLPGVCEDLIARGIARESDDALVVFFEEGSGLEERPFLVRKRDGAFLYATTDIATIRHRVDAHGAQRIIYVVDVRQSLHFKQLFETARLMGYEGVRFEHVGFGMMLGPDGTPYKTREGGTVLLESLLDEAEERILPVVQEKWPEASEQEQRVIAAQVGIGAVKYADLNQNRTTNYKFEWDKLLAVEGNTGPYLMYTLVRCRSVQRKYEAMFGEKYVADGGPLTLAMDEELALAKALLGLEATLDRVGATLMPHFICEYLYELARASNLFWAKCSILKADTDELRRSRMALCVATETAMALGLRCLGVPRVDRM